MFVCVCVTPQFFLQEALLNMQDFETVPLPQRKVATQRQDLPDWAHDVLKEGTEYFMNRAIDAKACDAPTVRGFALGPPSTKT